MKLAEFERDGFALVPALLHAALIEALITAFHQYSKATPAASEREGAVYGLRNVLREMPLVRELVCLPQIRQTITPLLGEEAFAVRALFFDKTAGANWHFLWHQDKTITVRERIETPGFGPWSEKAGVVHVQPPVTVLERMVALRLHLDDCGRDNGPLRVLPGTHSLGLLDTATIARLRVEKTETVCEARRGDGLLMRPLLLHTSGKVVGNASHRRVLHIEWAAEALPNELRWHDRVSLHE